MNHYEVLGLIPSVEQPVIRAAYKALVNIYHPDKNPSKNEDYIKKINIAYETLSNPKKKRVYDKEIKISENTASRFSFSSTPSFDTKYLNESWDLAISFYPVIKAEYEILKNISWTIAYSFKLELLESKDFSNSSKIFLKKKDKYLSRYFGDEMKIIDYAEKLILIGEIDAVLELNSMIKTMGKSVSRKQLEIAIENKFPKANARIAYFQLKAHIGEKYNRARSELIKMQQGELKYTGFFSNKYLLLINNHRYEFKNIANLDDFLLELLSAEYEDK